VTKNDIKQGDLQQLGFDYKETYTPVTNRITIRTLLCVLNLQNLYMCQLDVTKAFIILDEEIYISSLKALLKTHLYFANYIKLSTDSNKHQNVETEDLLTFITSQGFIRSESDNCLYIQGDKVYFSCTYLLLLYFDVILLARENNIA